MKLLRKIFLSLTVIYCASMCLHASQTYNETLARFADWMDGRFDNVALTRNGHLRLSPGLELLAKVDAPILWTAVADQEGAVYFTTGGDSAKGELMKMTAEGIVSSIFKAEEPLLGALAIDAKGTIYIGSSPEGVVYRMLPGGKPEVFFRPGDTYIWDLLCAPDGRLFVATGTPKAKIYCLNAASNLNDPASCLWFSCDQKDFTVLAQAKDGAILASTGSSGFLYRIAQKNQAQVLAFTEGEEITGIEHAQDGSVYFCTFVSPKKDKEDSKSVQAIAFMPKEGDKPGQPPLAQAADKPATKKPELGSFYRIDPQGFVLPVWAFPQVNIYSMTMSSRGTWLMGTSEKGRVFDVQNAQSWCLLQQAANGGEVCEMLPDTKHPGSTYVLTSNPACIYRLAASVAGNGTFTSSSYDAEQVAHFGSFSSLCVPVTTSLVASWETRTGNTPDADDTWSVWKPLSGAGKVDSPVGRFFQYRLTLKDPNVEVYQARFFYDYTNVAPVIHVLRMLPFAVQVLPNSPNPLLPVELKSLLQSSPEDIMAELSSKMRPQLRVTPDSGWMTAAWAAEDYNDDPLLFTVKVRPIGTPTWMIIADELDAPLYSFNTNGLQEGYYQLVVVASDSLSNTTMQMLTTERLSAPFVIDCTPPAIEHLKSEPVAQGITLVFRAKDSWSVISGASYTLNGKESQSLLPDDGIYDSKIKDFTVTLKPLLPGDYSVVFQVEDELGNSALMPVGFKVQ